MRRLPFKMRAVAAAVNAVLANNTVADSARLTNPDNSHSYLRYDTPKDWNTAKTACANLNGHLATITSQQEQDWVTSNLTAGGAKGFWLGGTDEGHEGTWNWITNETWNYTNYRSGEPNNFTGAENSLVMDADGKWNDCYLTCAITYSFSYLCEWDNPVDLYNPNADFSATNGNPNGVWAYGWMPTDFSIFNFDNLGWAIPNTSSTIGWAASNTSIVWKNTSTSTFGAALPGQLSLHPGSGTEPGVLRWTAPIDGQYRVVGQFLAGDAGTMLVGVRQGNIWLWQGTNAGAFDLNATVIADETIDFTVYGSYYGGTTPLDVNILLTSTNLLTVAKTGNGTGSITSTPAGLNCGTTCAATFASDTEVALEATPAADSVFDGWSEDSDQDCADGLITTDANKTCIAIFNLAEIEAVQAPTAVTNTPSVITSNTAKLRGIVVPNGAATTANFTCNHLTAAVAANPGSIAADASATNVSGNVANLICKTSYTCRVIASNSVGTTTANDQTFTTADICVPNPVTTRPATNVAATSATLNGMVTPNGANTTVSFDLGTTTSYGTSVPATVGIINAAATATAVKGNKIGLTCNTTYNYRVKAVNSVGTTYGANASFKTTTPCPTPPDLVVTSITTSPAAPVANGKFSATVTIKNQGGPMTSGAVVDVWANKATTQTCGAFGNDWEIVDPLAAGATTTVTITDLPAGTAGMKMLRAFVDSDCSVTEANDTNNQFTATYAVNAVSGPDFTVTSITLNPVAPVVNGTFTATVKVKNSGTVAGDGKSLDVWSNQSATQICGAAGNKRLAVGTLNAGASKTLTFTGIAAGAAGSKIFRAFVDSGCGIGEKLEGNNQNTKAYVMNATSCLAIKTATPTAPSGTYTIDPDGTGAIAPLAVYCDMTTDGGGWTLATRILGNSRSHVNVNAVGTLTASNQTTVAKLADATINAVGRSYYRLTCNGLTDFLKYNNGWLSTAGNGTTYWTGNNKAGDWAQASAGNWLYNAYSSDSDVGGGSWPDYDALQYNADGTNGCYQNGYGRDGVLWVK